MRVPSSKGGKVTEEVGLFEMDGRRLAKWLRRGLAKDPEGTATLRRQRQMSREKLLSLLSNTDNRHSVTRAIIPFDGWALMLTDGPEGTDIGLLHHRVPEVFGCTAIRASVGDSPNDPHPGTLLEIVDAEASRNKPFGKSSRTLLALVEDSGRWYFESKGEPFDFEEVEAYTNRRIRDRFTPEMLYRYLEAMRAPTYLPDVLHDVHLIVRRY